MTDLGQVAFLERKDEDKAFAKTSMPWRIIRECLYSMGFIVVRQMFVVAFVCLMTSVAIQVSGADDAREDRKPITKLLIPAYFYPAGEGLKTWNRLIVIRLTTRSKSLRSPILTAET